MSTTINEDILNELASGLELPDSTYEKAKGRYEDLGQWLSMPLSGVVRYSPHILPQGSFRLGTAIRPLTNEEEYDLDITCRLESDLNMSNITQAGLRAIIRKDIEAYRQERKIETPIEEHHRCLRLEYKDTIGFHMDIVPCIPDSEINRRVLQEAYSAHSYSESLIKATLFQSSRITDDRRADYQQISIDWLVSNPEGYAQWFEEKMRTRTTIRLLSERAQVDNLPTYKKKTPLQRSIQILKRHRDSMFISDPDLKPISIIITTLAARAYNGEDDIESALTTILEGMERQILPTSPRVPNPVNPSEDFADKWRKPEYWHLHLEENFKRWILQAKVDIKRTISASDPNSLQESVSQRYAVTINDERARELTRSKGTTFSKPVVSIPNNPPKPWRD